MQDAEYNTADPNDLLPNPWNTNRLAPEAELKLEESIRSFGMFKPIIVRTLEDGRRQILGGENRARIAARLGMSAVPVFDVGMISDVQAKKIGLVDNTRYGHDDSTMLAELLRELGTPIELSSFMPYDPREFETMLAVAQVDLSQIGFDEDDKAPVDDKITRATKTHTTMKFKVPIEDQATIEATIKSIIATQGFDDSDSTVRAGDALVWLLNNMVPKDTSDDDE